MIDLKNEPLGRPLTDAEADSVLRNRHLGWTADTIEEAHDRRYARMREGLRPMPQPPCDSCQPALHRARLSGLMAGLVLAVIAHLVGFILLTMVNAHWPIACDGTASLGGCALRLIAGLA
ncbi:hypothetical protein [Paracoccus sp. ME4]|uniref:hypothetical protein n=1 Tax=Paracoccus sp. ME4 TaxID=3138066 RepID=UPI00398BA4D0